MQKYEVRILLMDHRGKRRWRKRLNAPNPIVAGEAALILLRKKPVFNIHILNGSVLPRGGGPPLALWPFAEPVDSGDPLASHEWRWVLTSDITPEQFAEWYETGAITDGPE